LNIRDERSAGVRAFIPIKPEPAQILDDRVGKFSPATIPIQIFDPQNQLATGFPCTFLRSPERHRVTDVQKARRRWCDTAAVFRHPERSVAKSTDPAAKSLR
jgi:hypothetical protein